MASSASATKPTTNGHVAPHHSPESQPQAGGVLEGLVRAINTLSTDKNFQAMSMLIEENTALRERNKKLEHELSEHAVAQRKTFEAIAAVRTDVGEAESGLRRKDKELKEAVAREAKVRQELDLAQRAAGGLRKELEASREKVGETMTSLNARGDQIKMLQDAVEAAGADRAELARLREEHAAASLQLTSLQELALPLRKVDSKAFETIKQQLDSFFVGAYRLADQFFGQVSLSEDAFQDKSWASLSEDARLANIPLCPTNSEPARRMRAAAVLRLIALAAVEHLLQPVYLTEEGGEVRDILDTAHYLDAPRSQQLRGVLLRVAADTQLANGRRRAEATSGDVFRAVRPLLAAVDGCKPADRQADFRRGLEAWCETVREQWMRLQDFDVKFTVLFEVGRKGFRPEDWRRVPDTPAPTPAPAPPSSDAPPAAAAEDVVAQLWPAFFASKKDGQTRRCRGGYVLVRSQASAARKELAGARASAGSSARQERDAQRRRAMLTDGSNHSIEDLPAFLS